MKLRCTCGYTMRLMVDQCKHISYLYSEETFEKAFTKLSESDRSDFDFDIFYSDVIETRKEVYFCSNCHRHYIQLNDDAQKCESYIPENEIKEHEIGCFAPDSYIDNNMV